MLDVSINFLKHVPAYFFWKDKNFIFQGCNQSFVKAASLETEQAIIGRSDYDLPWAYTEADKYRRDDEDIISQGVEKLNIVETQSRAGGLYASVIVSKAPIFDEKNRITGLIGIAQDISVSHDIKQFQNSTFLLSQDLINTNRPIILAQIKKILQNECLLTEEMEYLSLWIAGFSTTEASLILQTSKKIINMYQTSIKRKMNLTCLKQVKEFTKELKIFNLFLLFSRILSSTGHTHTEQQRCFTKLQYGDYTLSLRESQCLSYLIQGKSTKAIANALSLSTRTIEHYINKLKIKMGVSFKSELVEKAFHSWHHGSIE